MGHARADALVTLEEVSQQLHVAVNFFLLAKGKETSGTEILGKPPEELLQ